MVAETGFNSSPVTKGVVLRARKPFIAIAPEVEKSSHDSLSKYQEFLDAVYAEGVLDRKTKHLIALGASLTIGSEPWTERCLEAAKEHGATDEELKETMAIAMSLGAERIKILQESGLASVLDSESRHAKDELEEEAASKTSPST